MNKINKCNNFKKHMIIYKNKTNNLNKLYNNCKKMIKKIKIKYIN